MKKHKILIANDDGIRAPGIALLANIAAEFADVYVVAPEGQCSGMSAKLTILPESEMALRPYDFPAPVKGAWSLDGTPADCVKVALKYVLDFKPDAVLSGINDGMNAGLDVAYSGTIGAATEGVLNGVQSIAFSCRDKRSTEVAAQYLPSILQELLEKPLAPGLLWNVNFPTCPLSECRGILRERYLEKHSYYENSYTCVREENGAQYLSPVALALRADQTALGSDINAVLDNYISIGTVRCAPF